MKAWRTSRALRTALAALAALSACAPSARAADLASVLDEVAARNPQVVVSAARADAARERGRRAGAWEAPMLELGVVNVPVSGRFDEDPMTMKTLGIRQRISPRLLGDRRAGRAGAGAAAEDARLTRQQALGAALEAYVIAWSAGERVAATERHLSLLARTVESARARYAAGSGRLEDVLRTRSEAARLQASLLMERYEERAARLRLAALRGRAPEFEAESLAAPALGAVTPGVASWLAAVDENHPRLRAADAEVSRFRFAAGAARTARWPMLDVMYEYGFREDLTSSHGATENDDMFAARVGLSLPVFTGERREAAEMSAMARAAEAERRAANLELLEAVALAHEDARAGAAIARLLADTVLVAERAALDGAWSAYGSNATELPRVLEAAHALYDDELRLTRARQQAMAAQARFYALTGRGDLIGLAWPAAEEGRR